MFNHHKTNSYKYSYIMPYKKTNNGDIECLIGQKQVISFRALKDSDENPKLIDKIKHYLFKGDFSSPFIQGRYFGLFLAAGGRPAFFGGSLRAGKNNKHYLSPKEGAIKEFFEELGDIGKRLQTNDAIYAEILANLKEVTTTQWGGIYYSLNLDNCEKLKLELTTEILDHENKRVLNHNNVVPTLSKSQRIDTNICDHIPEMHCLYWVNLVDLEKHMDQKPDIFIQEQVNFACKIILDHLQIKNEKTQINFAKCIVEKTKEAPVTGNVEAAMSLKLKIADKPKPANKKIYFELFPGVDEVVVLDSQLSQTHLYEGKAESRIN